MLDVRCWLLVVFLPLFLCGCASTPKHKVALTGDIMVDGPKMAAEGPPNDKMLWQYRTAAAAMRRGQFEVAKPMLDEALTRLQGIYGKDAEARKARGYFSKEARKTFLGEPYERSMAYFYRGILYWMDGEPDNARACFRSAEFEDSDAENKEYAGDWVLPDFFDGYITTKLGSDGSDALKRARENVKNINLPDYQVKANVVVIVEFGPGPVKYSTGEYKEELRIRERPSSLVAARIKTSGINLPVAPTDNVSFQATTRGGRQMDHILANKAVFKKTTDTVGDAALIGGIVTAAAARNRTTQSVGLGLVAAGVISKIVSAAATPDADTRTWDNLPRYISYATMTLPVGQHAMTIEFEEAGGKTKPDLTKNFTVNITATDRDKVIFVSDTSTTPQTL